MDDLSDNLSASNEEEDEDGGGDAEEYGGISFLRSDFSWNMTGKKDEIPVTAEDEDESEDETETQSNGSSGSVDSEDEMVTSAVGKWTNRDVHDVKYNEDKLAITFKVGRLGIYGLAVNWYSNLPFQTWELRPDVKEFGFLLCVCLRVVKDINNYIVFFRPGSVTFSLTASVINIEVIITTNGFLLNSFQVCFVD